MAVETGYESLFGGAASGANKRRPGRPKASESGGPKAITKSELSQLFELANFGLAMSPLGDYQLTKAEVDELVDCWMEVIRRNPAISKYLAVANVGGMWGKLIYVHFQIIAVRVVAYQARELQAKRGAAKPPVTAKPNGVVPPPPTNDHVTEKLS